MAHDTHTTSNAHLELEQFGTPAKVLELVHHWQDPFPPPQVTMHKLEDGRTIQVVRDDFVQGTKVRAGDAVLASPRFSQAHTLVYVQPRAGWAGLSLAALAKVRGQRLILFCPAAAVPSGYQRLCADRGAELRAVRVAAMPVLNGYAKKFADERGFTFIPLGLNVPEAVAGIGKVARSIKFPRKPSEIWCVASTGVLTRGLQIAWPLLPHNVVAVARNLHDGEKGKATVYSHPLPFLKPVSDAELPPYPSASTYDAKAWAFVKRHALNNAVVWNVAGNPPLPSVGSATIDLAREWGDFTDLQGA
ncbi:MAG: hypothetical protein PHU06_06245 [Gallionella sp.]|nr:hypothetical protein [Gallionella sp.]MDD4958434.1 hypothetical protein [Gallionella sp.]